MEIWTTLLLTLVAGSAIFVLTWLLVRERTRTADLLRQQSATHQIVSLRQLDVIEKSFAQLRASDPWQYQSIQAMAASNLYDEVYDPSEEAEAKRIADRNNKNEELEENLNAEEAAALDDLFPGGFTGPVGG